MQKIKDYIKKEKFEIVREIIVSVIISALVFTTLTFLSDKK